MLRSEWKCGNCNKIYSIDDFLTLENVKLVESDTNPKEQHGYTPACECGYRFHLDRWLLHDSIKIKIGTEDRDVLVSSAYLELNHGWWFDKYLWYETMIFIEDEEGKDQIICNYQDRYETKEEAINDHNRIVNLLKEGMYNIKDLDEDKKELIILEN